MCKPAVDPDVVFVTTIFQTFEYDLEPVGETCPRRYRDRIGGPPPVTEHPRFPFVLGPYG
jgi:hypothetical protein